MPKKPLNLAHRGFSGKYPENTLLAFKQAHMEGKCDGFFINVHITADRQVVVINDATIDRTTNGSGYIKDMSYAELLNFDAGAKFDPYHEGQKIPLLSEVLEYAQANSLVMHVELKNCDIYYDDLERVTIRMIQEAKMQNFTTISSFNHLSVEKCKAIDADIITGYMCGCPMLHANEYMQKGRAKALLPHYRVLFYDRLLAQNIKDAGYSNYAWTVNDLPNMERMLELGLDGIITDYPNMLTELMAEYPDDVWDTE